MSDGVIQLVAPCIRCGVMFIADPETVPSVWVHVLTRCSIQPDGRPIVPCAADTVKEPLCVLCASLFNHINGRSVPLLHLFPRARTDLITIAAVVPS